MAKALLLSYKDIKYAIVSGRRIAVAGIHRNNGSYVFLEPIEGVASCCTLDEDKTGGHEFVSRYQKGIDMNIYTIAERFDISEGEQELLCQHLNCLRAALSQRKPSGSEAGALVDLINKMLSRLNSEHALSPSS